MYECKLDKVTDKGLSDPDITLQQLLQYAKNLEVTLAHSKAMKGQMANALKTKHKQTNKCDQQIPKPQQVPNNKQTNKRTNSNNKTYNFCGNQWHKQGLKDCPARGKTCTKCAKMNHFRTVCMSSHVQNITHENNTNSNSNDEEDADYTWHINTKPRKFSPHFNIDIGNSSVSMMADSGASVNLLTERDYRNSKELTSLRPSPARIYTYGETQPIANAW